MTITVTRDRTGKMRDVAQVRAHRIPIHKLMAQATTEIVTEPATAGT